MKLAVAQMGEPSGPVASRAEAWIETQRRRRFHAGLERVASRAEAWIETTTQAANLGKFRVASRAEAWIETSVSSL